MVGLFSLGPPYINAFSEPPGIMQLYLDVPPPEDPIFSSKKQDTICFAEEIGLSFISSVIYLPNRFFFLNSFWHL